MQRLFSVFADDILWIEAAISLTGLCFMCAMTYAMRWFPGKPEGEAEHENAGFCIGAIDLDSMNNAYPVAMRNRVKDDNEKVLAVD